MASIEESIQALKKINHDKKGVQPTLASSSQIVISVGSIERKKNRRTHIEIRLSDNTSSKATAELAMATKPKK